MYIKPEEFVTEISMTKKTDPWLYVEGSTDERFFRARLFPVRMTIQHGNGWEDVIEVLNLYDNEAKKNVRLIGLIDRDYHEHLNTPLSHPNLIHTDLRDLENILFTSNALVRVVSEHGEIQKLPDNNGTIHTEEMREKIYTIAVQLGKFRIYCKQHRSDITLKNIDHKKFICDTTLAFNINAFINHVKGKNPGKNVLEEEWKSAQGQNWSVPALNTNVFIAQGHDIMNILVIALKRMWGSCGNSLDSQTLESYFRTAYTNDELEDTMMWQELIQKVS